MSERRGTRGSIAPILANAAPVALALMDLPAAQSPQADSQKTLLTYYGEQAPRAVVVESQGDGIDSAYLRMATSETWRDYGDQFDVRASYQGRMVPMLTPGGQSREIGDRLTEAREAAVRGGQPQLSPDEIRSELRQGVEANLSESKWHRLWTRCMLGSVGVDATTENAEAELRRLNDQDQQVFLIADLENIFPDVERSKAAQTAVRTLLTDCTEMLRDLPGKNTGMVVFVSEWMVDASLPQNAKQFQSKHSNYAFR